MVVVITIVVINSILTTVKTHDAAMTIKSNMTGVPAYQVANLGRWHGSLPMARTTITTTTVDMKNNDYAAAYDEEAVGGYLWGTGEIVVKPQASQMVLAHEYGHALTADALTVYENGDMTAATNVLFDEVLDFNRTSDVRELPAQLRDVAAEYQSVDPDIYGSTYYTERLTEYLAQSFARYTAGQTVPPVVGEWLAELDGEGR
jgi:hypothetical protein